MNTTIEWKKTQPGSTEAVQFSDGMLVTAEDLGAAMHYPLSVVQVLLRAFFGCGIVCGLDMKAAAQPPPGQAEQRDAAGNVVPPRPPECDADYGLIIDKGVALGCDGYPIELCGPLKLDLTPDPCRLDRDAKQMFVAIRRVTAAEASARPCGCGSAGDSSGQQCSRMRDHALVQAFDKEHLPKELCWAAAAKTPGATVPATGAQTPDATTSVCDCLKQCGACACCGDPWVLLGTVMVSDKGLEAIDIHLRRYVKPVACICGAPRSEAAPAQTGHAQYGDDGAGKAETKTQTAPGVATNPAGADQQSAGDVAAKAKAAAEAQAAAEAKAAAEAQAAAAAAAKAKAEEQAAAGAPPNPAGDTQTPPKT